MKTKSIFLLFSLILLSLLAHTQTFYVNENFNAGTLPSGWTSTAISGAEAWSFGIDAASAHSGNQNLDGSTIAFFDDDNLGGGQINNTADLLSPIFDNTTAGYTSLEFDYNFRQFGGISDEFSVDVFNVNDTVTAIANNTSNIRLTPYSEDFDGFTVGSVVSNTNDAINGGWIRNSNATNQYTWRVGESTANRSSSTGPAADNGGTGYFMYTEASSGGAGSVATIESPSIDLLSTTGANLIFYYHRYGSQMGNLFVDVYNGTTWVNNVATISAKPQTNSADPFTLQTVNLSAYAGLRIKVRFRAISQGCCAGDMAIDDILVYEPIAQDASLFDLLAPISGCGLSTATPISIEVENFGTAAIAANTVVVNFKVDNRQIVSETLATSIPVGAKRIHNFIGTNDLSTPGRAYTIKTWTKLLGDSNVGNDTLEEILINKTKIVNYSEDFQNFPSSTGLVTLGSGWEATPISASVFNFGWRVANGATPTGNTGPDVDHTLGSNTGKYMYLETNGSPSGGTSIGGLVIPCIDLTNVNGAILNFWYHKFGAGQGDLYVDVHDSSLGGWLQGVGVVRGQTHFQSSDSWLKKTVDLSLFAGKEIKIRFRGFDATDVFSTGDMAIDDVRIEEIFDTDLKVVDIFSNELNVCPGLEDISVKLRNDGDTIFFQQDTFRLEFRKNQNTPVISYLYDTNVVKQAFLLPNDSLIIKIPNINMNYSVFFNTELYQEAKLNTYSKYIGIVQLDPPPDSIKLETDTSFKTLRCFNDKYLLSVEANSSNVIWQVSYGNGFLDYKFYDSTFTILPTDTFLMVRPNICNNLYYPDTFYLASITRPSKVIPIIRGNRDTIANCSDSSEFCVFIPNMQDSLTEFTWFKHGIQFDGDTFKLAQRYFTTGQVDQVSVQIRTGSKSAQMGFSNRTLGSNLSNQSINEVDFSVLKKTVLNSFDVYSSSLGKCFVEIMDLSSGIILDTINIDTMSAGLHQIALNKKLTVGNYRLRIHAITTSFYQQSTTPSNMYYSADSSLKIIGVNPTFGVFYNWRIGSECVTNEEVLLYSFCLVNIGEDIFLNEISIFPNPSTGIFNIQFSSQIDRAQIEIRDIQGRIVIHEETIQSANYQLDLSKQPKGVYFIQIRNGEAVLNEKIIVQ